MDLSGVTGALTAFLIAAVPLALLVTKAVDTTRNLIDGGDSFPKVVWNVAAFVFGLVLCLGWQFNPVAGLAAAIPALSDSSALTGVAGQILSGLAIGAMAGFWHEKLDLWSSTAKTEGATVTQ